MKKLVIVKPGCKELGNELINRMSIYACGLEVGARVLNRSPYGYPAVLKALHALYARIIGRRYGACSLNAWRAPIFLPPTAPLTRGADCDTLYLFGWVFRNPVGIEKYRKEITTAFTPNKVVQKEMANILSLFPSERTLIGIHVRQKPFPGFPRGNFLVPIERVRQIVDEYVLEKRLDARNDVALLIVSDLPIPKDAFAGYAHRISYGASEANLFSLARARIVIGTNTTFSNTAAWFGNVPHIVTTDEPIDWAYYRTRTVYFENKYATFAY